MARRPVCDGSRALAILLLLLPMATLLLSGCLGSEHVDRAPGHITIRSEVGSPLPSNEHIWYGWTNPETRARFAWSGSPGISGSVEIRFSDGEGREVERRTLDPAADHAGATRPGTPGAWGVDLHHRDLRGQFELTVQACSDAGGAAEPCTGR